MIKDFMNMAPIGERPEMETDIFCPVANGRCHGSECIFAAMLSADRDPETGDIERQLACDLATAAAVISEKIRHKPDPFL